MASSEVRITSIMLININHNNVVINATRVTIIHVYKIHNFKRDVT